MTELFELIALIEDVFNRPFGILLIIAGLSFLLIAVLFKLNDIHNKMANITALFMGTALILAGAVTHFVLLAPPKPPSSLENQVLGSLPDVKSQVAGENTDLPERSNAVPPPKKTYLRYARVAQFEFIWNNKTDQTNQKTAFYKPLAPAGYKILGHYAQGDYHEPLDQGIAVKAASENEAILAYPVRYECIWQDTNRSEIGKQTRAIWRPIPPIGYRCLGDVATLGHSRPDPKEIVCVKEFLVTRGKPGELIWNDEETRGISVFPVLSEDPLQGLALNLFQGYGSQWSRRSGYASLPVLKNGHIAPVRKPAVKSSGLEPVEKFEPESRMQGKFPICQNAIWKIAPQL